MLCATEGLCMANLVVCTTEGFLTLQDVELVQGDVGEGGEGGGGRLWWDDSWMEEMGGRVERGGSSVGFSL
jgi:hypothetical protein